MKPLTQAYRRETLKLRAQTIRSMQAVWPALDWKRLDDTYPAWAAATAALVDRDHAKAAQVAGLYVEALRRAEKVPGAATIIAAEQLDREQLATTLRVTSLVAAKRAAQAGAPGALAMSQAFVQASGAATRLVLNGGRDTVRASVAADQHAVGWQRVGVGQCDFCQMLLGRGAVYTEATASFESHDHCACSAEPVYR